MERRNFFKRAIGAIAGIVGLGFLGKARAEPKKLKLSWYPISETDFDEATKRWIAGHDDLSKRQLAMDSGLSGLCIRKGVTIRVFAGLNPLEDGVFRIYPLDATPVSVPGDTAHIDLVYKFDSPGMGGMGLWELAAACKGCSAEQIKWTRERWDKLALEHF
jgi:hypothetical protein